MPLHTVGPLARPYYIIHVVLEGSGTFTTAGRKYRLTQGDLFLIRPDQSHQYISDPSDPWVYSWIAFTGPLASDIMAKTPFGDEGCVIQSQNPSQYVDIIQSSLRLQEFSARTELKFTSLVYDFLSTLMGDQINEITATSENYLELPAKAMEYLMAHYAEQITVADVADAMFVNRSHLSRVFKDYFGITVQDALHQVRINAGANLLKTTNRTMLEIALAVGFNSQIVFNRAFKKSTGITPREFRKSQHPIGHIANDHLDQLLAQLDNLEETTFST
jgi:AraC-like DNA-binding protein